VPSEIAPAALARLLDFAERPRVQDWSLRAALVRYPQPQRVNDVLDCVRRLEWALGRQTAVLERDGPNLWAALTHDATDGESDAHVVGLLRAAQELDRLGDVLATWAVDVSRERPDAEVDLVVASVARQLDVLDVPREERRPARPPSRSAR
jgi:hypothetical protein